METDKNSFGEGPRDDDRHYRKNAERDADLPRSIFQSQLKAAADDATQLESKMGAPFNRSKG
jgi:hypothetical protein